jgi:CheY-like chemotaxis protein
LEKLRADPALTRIPVMMLTSLSNGLSVAPLRNINASGEYYVDDFIDKPIRPTELLERVERLLGLRNARSLSRSAL